MRPSIVVLLLLVLTVVPSGTAARTSNARRAPRSPLDLAAVQLVPEDLADQGLPEDFGYARSESPGLDQYVDEWLAGNGVSAGYDRDVLLDRLSGDGWQRHQASTFARPPDDYAGGADPDHSGMEMTSYITVFEDEAGAGDRFALLEEEAEDPAADDVSSNVDLGDESEITHGQFTVYTETDTIRAEYLDLTFRDGNVVAGVYLGDFNGEPVDQSAVEGLAGTLDDRLNDVRDGEDIPLSQRALRFDGPGLISSRSTYQVRDGNAVPQYPDATVETLPDGEMERYSSSQSVSAGQNGVTDDGAYGVFVHQFASADDAQSLVDQLIHQRNGQAGVTDVIELNDIPTIGDRSAAVSYVQSHRDTYDLRSSVDDRVALTRLTFPPGTRTPEEIVPVLASLASAQAACLAQDATCEPVAVPDLLDLDTEVSAGTPASGAGHPGSATPQGRFGPHREPAARTTYESPQYDYALSYDAARWTIVADDPYPDDEVDSLALTDGVTEVTIYGDPIFAIGDASDCVDYYTIYSFSFQQMVPEPTLFEVDGVQVTGENATQDQAFAAYAYTNQDAGSADDKRVEYVECRTVGDGFGVVIVQDSTLDDYASASASREELLTGLVVG